MSSAVAMRIVAGAVALARWTRDTRAPLASLLRLFYGPLLYWTLYHQVQTLWPVLHQAPLDGALAALEARLWGGQPALAFAAALPSRWLSELFCFAYFAYYFVVPVVGLAALRTRGYATAEGFILAVTVCFLVCYTGFWLAPTVGPHYWFPPGRGPELYRGYLFNHLLFGFTAHGEIRGGACPSSHIAVAFLATLWTRRRAPALFPFLAAITGLMLPAVVYLRAHYLLDVPAGLLVGGLVYRLTRREPPWIRPENQPGEYDKP